MRLIGRSSKEESSSFLKKGTNKPSAIGPSASGYTEAGCGSFLLHFFKKEGLACLNT
jgi:hypothetical protein